MHFYRIALHMLKWSLEDVEANSHASVSANPQLNSELLFELRDGLEENCDILMLYVFFRFGNNFS